MSLTFGVLGGVLAGAVFKQRWKLAAGDDDAPDATDADKGWGEVFTAAAVQGAIFALVKRAVDGRPGRSGRRMGFDART